MRARSTSGAKGALALALTAAFLSTAFAAVGAASADSTGCATPNVCATVLPDDEVYSVSLYDVSGPTRVTATGTIHVEAQVGHFVEIDLSVEGNPWSPAIAPAHIRLQTPADIPFTATVDVPSNAADGVAVFTVRARDPDNLFPIDSTGSFQVAIFRGPLALYSEPFTDPPLPGETATWSLTLRNLASFDIDYNPVFELPDGFESYVRIPTTQIVEPGREAEVLIDLTAPATAAPGDYTWSVRFESQTHPEVSVGLTQPFAVRSNAPLVPSAHDDVMLRYWPLITLGLFGVGAVLFFSFTEVGYVALAFSLIVPMFTRLKSDRVLDNFTRGQIYGYIRANPGAHYSEIHQALDVENGVLAYHLRVLTRESYIVARNEGVYKRFYPRDYKIPKRKRQLTRLQVEILEAVEDQPGMTQRALARHLGESRQVVSYNVRVLREAGLLLGGGSGRGASMSPSDEGTRAAAEARAALAAVEAPPADAA